MTDASDQSRHNVRGSDFHPRGRLLGRCKRWAVVTLKRVNSRVNPAKTHAVADAAVIYVVLLDTARGFLVLGGLATFVVMSAVFLFINAD